MLFVAGAHVDQVRLKGLPDGVSCVWFDDEGALLHDEQSGSTRTTLEEVQARIVATVFCSAAGEAAARKFSTAFADRIGTDAPPLIDLTDTATDRLQAELASRLIGPLARLGEVQARRNASLHRSIVQLRQQHAAVQASFSQLERYVADRGLNHRSLALDLGANAHQEPIMLEPGAKLVQRLPRASTGLSDIAVFVDKSADLQAGTLRISLTTAEDEQVHGEWQVTSPQLSHGWARLAFDVSLEEDPRTPLLSITWEDATTPLALGWSIRHPDPRFQAAIDGEATGLTLALRAWTYVPGCILPSLANSNRLIGASDASYSIVSPELLATAENLTPECEYFKLLDDHDALLIHVLPQGESVGRLRDLVPQGTRHVSATVMTRHNEGPIAEYALAIAPHDMDLPRSSNTSGGIVERAFTRLTGRRRQAPTISDLEKVTKSEWVRAAPSEEHQLNLFLEEPLPAGHDLYLFTRLAEPNTSADYGWTTFSNIRFSAGGVGE